MSVLTTSFVQRMVEKGFYRRFRGLASSSWKTLDVGSHSSDMKVKKSNFIAYAKHVDSWEKAQEYLSEIKREHPKARHWCYGYCGGVNPAIERSSDGGEPSGTAGAPIVRAIHGEVLSDTICVVVRYFGGIKLGAGGLIRAYGGVARQTLREAPKCALSPIAKFHIKVGSTGIGHVYEVAAKVNGKTEGEEYDENGNLSLCISCDVSLAEDLQHSLQDSTRGSVVFLDRPEC